VEIDIQILLKLLSFHSFIENLAPTGKNKGGIYPGINLFLATRKPKNCQLNTSD
jgi:hypothetical protein